MNKILGKDYTPSDWRGHQIQVGDIVHLIRVYELDYSINFLSQLGIYRPDINKPCWHKIATFQVTDFKEGAEKLYRYFHRNSGYDPDSIYETAINGNDLRHGCGSDTYILCIDGVSDDRSEYYKITHK